MMFRKWISAVCVTTLAVSMFVPLLPLRTTAQTMDRTKLPIAEPVYLPSTELDVRNAKAPPFFDIKAPKGAPNVVLVLLDDMGFGQPSAFGGGISMPTLDWLASDGLR